MNGIAIKEVCETIEKRFGPEDELERATRFGLDLAKGTRQETKHQPPLSWKRSITTKKVTGFST